MANEQNLIKPTRDRTAKQRRESARKAGKASAAKRRERMAMQEMAQIVLDMPCEVGDLDEIRDIAFEQFPDANLTVGQAAVLAVAKKAKRGDVAALTFLRDTAGEKPADKVEMSGDIAKASAEIRKMIDAAKAKDDAR